MSAFIENNNSNDENDGNNETIQINNKTPAKSYIRDLSALELIQQTINRARNANLNVEYLFDINSKNLKAIYFGDSNIKNLRKELESTTAQRQCNEVLGDSNIEYSTNDSYCFFNLPRPENETENNKYENSKLINSYCWLCGTAFHNKSRAIDCEHIIPILFAVLFLGVCPGNYVEKFSNEMKDAYSLNYLYAHSSCNRKKSNLLLIKWDEKNKKMIFDEENAKKLQDRIIKSKLVKVLNLINTDKEEDILNYKNAMMDNFKSKIEKICDVINKEYKEIRKTKDETTYVKYILDMTKAYLCEKTYLMLNDEMEKREKINELLNKNYGITEEEKINEINALNEELMEDGGKTLNIINTGYNKKIIREDNKIINEVVKEQDEIINKEENINEITKTAEKLKKNPENNPELHIEINKINKINDELNDYFQRLISNVETPMIGKTKTPTINKPPDRKRKLPVKINLDEKFTLVEEEEEKEKENSKRQKFGGNSKRKTIKKRKQKNIRKTIKIIKSNRKIINN
jgi:hypothetical protein